MRSNRTKKTLLGGVVASSALMILLAAAPAASTVGVRTTRPADGPAAGRLAAPAGAPSAAIGATTVGARGALAPAVWPSALAIAGSPNAEVFLIRSSNVARHAAWLVRRRASRLRLASLRSRRPSSQAGSDPHPGGSVRDMVVSIFSRIAGPGQVSTALCVANRESHFDPFARNPHSSAAGVFQWVASSWASYSRRYGFGGSSVFNAYANISVAAHAVANGGWGPWGGGCW